MTTTPLSFALLALTFVARACVETEQRYYDGSLACGGACPGSAPFCLESEAVCVACLDASHCGGGTPNCNPETHACEACAADDDCGGATPVCVPSTGRCEPCTADAECAARAGTPVCDEPSGACVACTADSEASRCGLYSCSRAALTCTSTLRGSVGLCGDCQADTECGSGSLCVARSHAGTSLGAYCLRVRPQEGCGSTASNPGLLPHWDSDPVQSVEGASATVCHPRDSISCVALQRAGAECPTATAGPTDACGDATLHDGQCAEFAGPSFSCTYTCVDAKDCKTGQSCTQLGADATSVCR